MPVLAQQSIEPLACRIQLAYVRCSGKPLSEQISDSRLWVVIAQQLLAHHRANPTVLFDPELFVQAQGFRARPGRSYMRLLEPAAWNRFRRAVQKIVNLLTRELRAEIDKLRAWVDRGRPIEEVVYLKPRRITPLACYLFCILEDRHDLAADFRLACAHQHAACPLYRTAFANLAPDSEYPVTFQVESRIHCAPSARPLPLHLLN